MVQRISGRMTTWFLLLAAALLISSGCGQKGPKLVPVSGMVAIDSKPLAGGFIRVVPENGRPSSGTIGTDGRFTLGCFTKNDGCIVGTHKVEVRGAVTLSESKRNWLAPRKYANAGSSGLTVTIDKATDALKIALTWSGSGEAGPSIEETVLEFRGGKASGSNGGEQ